MTGKDRVGRLWNRFWYSPLSSSYLGYFRAFFYAVVLLSVWSADFRTRASLDSVFWMPVFPWTSATPPSQGLIWYLEIAFKVSLSTACLGLFTRLSMAVSAILGFTLLSYLNCFGNNPHQYYATGLVLCILAFSRAGDAFSLDALLRRREEPELSADYNWPIRMIWVASSLSIFAAGFAKLRRSGLAWALSDNFSNIMAEASHLPYAAQPVWNLATVLADKPLLCKAIALTVLFLELGYPLLLLAVFFDQPRLRRWAVIFPVGMTISLLLFYFVLGHRFFGLLAAQASWLCLAVESPSEPIKPGHSGVTVLFTVLVLGSAGAILFFKEPFPFSCYPMYSSLNAGETGRYCLYGVTETGEEVLLEGNYPFVALDRFAIHNLVSRYRRERHRLELLLEHLHDHASRKHGQDFAGLRLYYCLWRRHGASMHLERRLVQEI